MWDLGLRVYQFYRAIRNLGIGFEYYSIPQQVGNRIKDKSCQGFAIHHL